MADLKGRLLKGAAGVNRGLNCREEEQEEFIDIIEQLEVGRRGGVGTARDRAVVFPSSLLLQAKLFCLRRVVWPVSASNPDSGR